MGICFPYGSCVSLLFGFACCCLLPRGSVWWWLLGFDLLLLQVWVVVEPSFVVGCCLRAFLVSSFCCGWRACSPHGGLLLSWQLLWLLLRAVVRCRRFVVWWVVVFPPVALSCGSCAFVSSCCFGWCPPLRLCGLPLWWLLLLWRWCAAVCCCCLSQLLLV